VGFSHIQRGEGNIEIRYVTELVQCETTIVFGRSACDCVYSTCTGGCTKQPRPLSRWPWKPRPLLADWRTLT